MPKYILVRIRTKAYKKGRGKPRREGTDPSQVRVGQADVNNRLVEFALIVYRKGGDLSTLHVQNPSKRGKKGT